MASARISCKCGAVNYPLEDSLPGATELCHCNPCRQTTGAMFLGFVSLKNSKPSPSVLEKCTKYASSKNFNRWFCSTCGTPLFAEAHHKADGTASDHWSCISGAIDPPDGSNTETIDIETNEWLADTHGDGGMAPILTKLGGRDIPCYDTDRKSKKYSSTELDEMAKTASTISTPGVDDIIKAECRCGGVSLRIKRANYSSNESNPNVVEYICKDTTGKAINDRYFARPCACRDCRLHTGGHLTSWIYLPPEQILNAHTGKPVAQHRDSEGESSANEGMTLKNYWSSEGVLRTFCSVCGASIFYTFDPRPEIINLAAGLLRPDEGGIMARQWLSWEYEDQVMATTATDRELEKTWVGAIKRRGKRST